MDNDDRPVGRVLTRREVLSLLAGLGGAAVLAACDTGSTTPQATSAATTGAGQPTAAPTATAISSEGATAVASTPVEASPTVDSAAAPDCVVKPELTEGPYFVDERLNRSDIRTDTSTGTAKEGIALALAFKVSQVTNSACTPLEGAQVDIWHCDAAGSYSDVTDAGFNTTGQNYLRGYQMTDANGNASFTTIYPGWYQGRAVHIHFKIRTTSTAQQSYEFTSQLFFDESITDQVHTQQPYAAKGVRTLKNEGDNIYRSGGSQLLIAPAKRGEGYVSTFNIALDLSDASAGQSDSNSGGQVRLHRKA